MRNVRWNSFPMWHIWTKSGCSDWTPRPLITRSVSVYYIELFLYTVFFDLYAYWFVTWKSFAWYTAFLVCCFTFGYKIHVQSQFFCISRMIINAYLRLLIFLPEILIPAWESSSLSFYVMYSAYNLNKQDDNIQPWCTPFPIWNQSVLPCPVLTVASWPAYRFLRRQVRWSGISITLRIFLSLLWSTQSKALV